LIGDEPPPAAVVAAFGLRGRPVRLSGGRGGSWRAGHGVLKRLDMAPAELEWHATVLDEIRPVGIRLARRLRAASGSLVVDGWTATSWLEGAHEPRWAAIVDAGERLHDALTGLARPPWLAQRTDPWSIGDRVAWEEAPVEPYVDSPAIRELAAIRRPIGAPSQLVHGDLTGNVLFAAGAAPAVIDLALYWRPRAFAAAVVVVDALAWHGADPSIVATVGPEDPIQFLIRAAFYRMVTDRVAGSDVDIGLPDGGPYRKVIDLIRDLR
jgi:uncharacterized protein (TIGR02569 family)